MILLSQIALENFLKGERPFVQNLMKPSFQSLLLLCLPLSLLLLFSLLFSNPSLSLYQKKKQREFS
jgi:hypothetical protein